MNGLTMLDSAMLAEDLRYGARPVVREGAAPRREPLPARPRSEWADVYSPCDGCKRARLCAVRNETCAAYRYAVRHDNPSREYALELRGLDLRRMRRFAD